MSRPETTIRPAGPQVKTLASVFTSTSTDPLRGSSAWTRLGLAVTTIEAYGVTAAETFAPTSRRQAVAPVANENARRLPWLALLIRAYASVIVTSKPSRVVAVDPRGGSVLVDVKTDAKVFAVAPAGLIAVSGRDMAYLPFR